MYRFVNPNCCKCGRFVGWDADSGAYWGSSQDPEPPDPIYFCKRCAEKLKLEAIQKGYTLNCYWCKPKWQIEAIDRISKQEKL